MSPHLLKEEGCEKSPGMTRVEADGRSVPFTSCCVCSPAVHFCEAGTVHSNRQHPLVLLWVIPLILVETHLHGASVNPTFQEKTWAIGAARNEPAQGCGGAGSPSPHLNPQASLVV